MKIFVVTKDGELYKPITKFYKTENKARASLISHLENIVWKEKIHKKFPNERIKDVAIRELLPEYEVVEFSATK